MTRARRRSKSQYLNAMRKMGYRPALGFTYRGGLWWRKVVWRFGLITLTVKKFSVLVAHNDSLMEGMR